MESAPGKDTTGTCLIDFMQRATFQTREGQIDRSHRGRREAISRPFREILPERKSLTVSSRL
jgi:hypothetical protein